MTEALGMVLFGAVFVTAAFGVPLIFYWLDQEKK